jgi:hypothetical protein
VSGGPASGIPAKGPTGHVEGCRCWKCTGFQPGHTLTLKHGAYANVAISPRAEELAEVIRFSAPWLEPADDLAVRALGVVLARVERAEDALTAAEQDDENDLDVLSRFQHNLRGWLSVAERYFSALGLTPASRARLGVNVAMARRLTVVELHAQAAMEQVDQEQVDQIEGEVVEDEVQDQVQEEVG